MKHIYNSEDGCGEDECSNSNVAKRYEIEKKTHFSELKKFSTAMEPRDNCTHLKHKKLYNALSLINNCTVELAAKFKLNNTGLNSHNFQTTF